MLHIACIVDGVADGLQGKWPGCTMSAGRQGPRAKRHCVLCKGICFQSDLEFGWMSGHRRKQDVPPMIE